MNERRAHKSAPPAAEPPLPDGLATPSSPSVANEPNLPPIAADADDLKAIKNAVDDAAAVGGGLWLSYLFVLFYLAVAAGAVTHADLFFEKPVKLPFLGIELPLLAFFLLAPTLFLVVHAYALVHLVMLTDKAKRYYQALHDPERNVTDAARENLQWQLPSNIFIQFLAGPPKVRANLFGWLLRAIAWITLAIAPVLMLLMMQIQFLPYHSGPVAWTQRVTLAIDLALIWWLWRKILSGREIDGLRRLAAWAWPLIGLALSLAVLLFSATVVTFPGERQEERLPSWRILPAMDQWGNPATERDANGNSKKAFADWVLNADRVSLHDWLFNAEPDQITRRRLPFSSTLVLPGLNVYEGLNIDDPDKVKGRDYIFRARGRDLKGAIFDLASLPNIDFTGAQLQGASLKEASLQGASLDDAQLQGASLFEAQLRSASLIGAQLQGVPLDYAQLQGASLDDAQLQGASLDSAQLQGGSLGGAQLEGATLYSAQLQGASLDGAVLQGASLEYAQLQGASLGRRVVRGVWRYATLQATDLSQALLWRSYRGEGAEAKTVRLTDSPDRWRPVWWDAEGNVQPWNDKAYQDLRAMMTSLPPGRLRAAALDRIRRLDCSNIDTALPSCIASRQPPTEADPWQNSLEYSRIQNAAYAKALALALKMLVCSGGDDVTYILRGLLRGLDGSRLAHAGPEAPALIDFIMSQDCPVSASLTDADKANLLRIKQDAIEKAGHP
jgi:uncharacterized protein YjbI with pentapeptide repeats